MWGRFKTLDPLLFVLPIIFAVIGVIFIYVLTVDTVGTALALRQGIAAGLGCIGMLVFSFIDYRAWRAWKLWIYLISIATLIAVLVFGEASFGAKSWINFGFYQFQPGEFAKLLLLLVLPAILQVRARAVGWQQFLLAVGALGLALGLVLLQPDLGTTLVLAVLGVTVFMTSRTTRLQKTVVGLVVALGVTTIGLSFMNVGPFGGLLKEYQKNRLASFIYPDRDPSGSGYNVLQSTIAVGSGGLTGKGLGFGSQSQLNFLPVVHSDFIFAAIAEAWGLVGSYIIIGLFILLTYRLIVAARIAHDEYGSVLCIGLAAMLLFELLVSVGMNIKVMPVTGIPLPFISYGGTAMLTFFFAMGVAQSVVIRSKRLTF